MPAELDREKAAAARAAAGRVKPGMKVALGTGSTAAFAVRAISEQFPDSGGLSFVASSRATEAFARELGLPVRGLAEGDRFDLMVDGADEVTPTLTLTKGGGGALFREKFLARLTWEVVIAVDHTKLVPRLAVRSPIPIEVVPFARPVLVHELMERGMTPTLRMQPEGNEPWITDNGNEILELHPVEEVRDPARLDAEIRAMPGVLETGICVGLAHRVYVGLPDGSVQEVLPAKGPK